MNGLRHDDDATGIEQAPLRRGRSFVLAPRALVTWVAAAACTIGVFTGAGCGIGLSGASVGTDEVEDAGLLAYRDAAAAVDAPTKTTLLPVVNDAGTSTVDSVARTQGSPLCGIPVVPGTMAVCNPDVGTCTPPYGGGTGLRDAAALPSLDDAAIEVTTFACRVTETRSEGGVASATPTCSPAGLGTGATACEGSIDCAPGFECVINAQNVQADGAAGNLLTGVCRHYCCDNVCAGPQSFCDIETTVGGSTAVPVCVDRPATDGGPACELLDDATCNGSGLVCQVVNAATGDVACVTAGTATVGESCETTKCGKGLSCIAGAFPDRTCAQLCNRENSDCPTGETCMENAALSSVNAQIGVCTL